jgi:flagellum-specific peptidoglycan hydrolase FlgJ
MSNNSIHDTQARAKKVSQTVGNWLQKYWLRMAMLGAAAYMITVKDVDFNLQLNNASASLLQTEVVESFQIVDDVNAPRAVSTSFAAPQNTSSKTDPTPVNVSNLANTYSNLTSTNKGSEKKESSAAYAAKRKKQLQYVKRFHTVAQTEMEKYGIPASITLAQGLLESNVGESKLATHNNNHFGIKCFSKSCSKGHCSNFTDDSHKDFFRKYKSSWESYRAHSLLLKRSDRYQQLFRLRKNDYKSWAHGLKKAGYATDQRYAEKIINLIEDLKLYKYD